MVGKCFPTIDLGRSSPSPGAPLYDFFTDTHTYAPEPMQSLDQPEDQGDHVKRVGVIGGGTMRTGIAKVVARASDSASFLEHDTTSANATADRIQSSLARAGKLGRRDSNVSSDIFARINVTLGTQTPPETPGG
ncbi:hypothetical protein GXW84_15970 [Rhodococcus sp. IEGM 248]|nr:hypothetical protein [Rhodococcus sp. IEGM 248]